MKTPIFISHDYRDKPIVDKLVYLLKRIKINGNSIFRPIVIIDDTSALQLREQIKQEIRDCGAMLLLHTRNSITNIWVNQETGYAEAQDKKIYCLKLKGHSRDYNPKYDSKGFLSDRRYYEVTDPNVLNFSIEDFKCHFRIKGLAKQMKKDFSNLYWSNDRLKEIVHLEFQKDDAPYIVHRQKQVNLENGHKELVIENYLRIGEYLHYMNSDKLDLDMIKHFEDLKKELKVYKYEDIKNLKTLVPAKRLGRSLVKDERSAIWDKNVPLRKKYIEEFCIDYKRDIEATFRYKSSKETPDATSEDPI